MRRLLYNLSREQGALIFRVVIYWTGTGTGSGTGLAGDRFVESCKLEFGAFGAFGDLVLVLVLVA